MQSAFWEEDNSTLRILIFSLASCIGCAPGIACLVISSMGWARDTECDGPYTIDLNRFLNLAGGLQVGFSLVYQCSSIFFKHIGRDDNPMGHCNCWFGLFLLCWAAIGMYMWDRQMDGDCRSEPIAQMVLAWSVLQYAMISVCCCVMFCLACHFM